MKDILNVKYSVDRKEEYQIKTVIYEELGIKYVFKEAYSLKAIQHIQNIYNNYRLLSNLNMSIVECKTNGERIEFPFIEGENLAQILLMNIEAKDKVNLENNLISYKRLLFQEELIEYQISNKFIEIFGVHDLTGHKSHVVSNIDLNFENIIASNNKYHVIDYEWVYDFPIPLEYVMYRAISQFFNRYHSQISDFITIKEVLKLWNIDSDLLSTFDIMEGNFMKTVAGGWVQQRNPYNKTVISRYELIDKYYIDSSENTNNIQIFWSKNQDFTEQQSQFFRVKNELKQLKIDIPEKGTQNIRIDPGEKPFVLCTITNTKVNGVDDFNLIKYFDSFSGVHIIKHEKSLIKCITTNSDPQLIFSKKDNFQNSTIKIEITFSEDKLELLSCMNLLINDNSEKENKITQLSEEIKVLDLKNIENLNTIETIKEQNYDYRKKMENLIYEKNTLNEQISEVSKINNEILNSKRWKVLSLFTKIRFIGRL